MSGNISNIKVSVIMNCYNSDMYLVQAIDSVLNQTYSNWELIFWDNQSTDNSAKIIKSYNDERIKYFFADSFTKLGEARNLAVKNATGEWLSFLDTDDFWDKDKIKESIVSIVNSKEKEISLVYSKTSLIDEKNKKIGYYTRCDSGYIHDKLLCDNNFIVQSSIMVKKDIFHKVGGINNQLGFCPDYDLLLKITKQYYAIGINKFLTFYRVHDGSITSRKMYSNNIELINYLIKYKLNINYRENKKIKFFLNKNILYFTTVLFIKLLIQKDFEKLAIVVRKYYKYLIFSPIVLPIIIINRLKK